MRASKMLSMTYYKKHLFEFMHFQDSSLRFSSLKKFERLTTKKTSNRSKKNYRTVSEKRSTKMNKSKTKKLKFVR